MIYRCTNIGVKCILKKNCNQSNYYDFNFCIKTSDTQEVFKLINYLTLEFDIPLERMDITGFSNIEEDKIDTLDSIKTIIIKNADNIKKEFINYDIVLTKKLKK